MEAIFIIVGILGLIMLIDEIYVRVDLEKYSPIWEYFFEALLYGVIVVFTLLYGKESLHDVSPLEWAIVAVSAIEGTGNYINYVKEAKRRKVEKAASKKSI